MKITKYKPNQDSKGNINFKILSQSRTAGPNRAFLQNMLVKLEPSESRGTFEPAIVPRIRQALLQPSKLQVKIPIAIHIMTRPKFEIYVGINGGNQHSLIGDGFPRLGGALDAISASRWCNVAVFLRTSRSGVKMVGWWKPPPFFSLPFPHGFGVFLRTWEERR